MNAQSEPDHRMRIVVAADNAGIDLKNVLLEYLRADQRIESVEDLGVHDADDQSPYPDLGFAGAERVASGEVDRALLICGTGIGMAISANKVPTIRAAVGHDSYSVERSIKSNDCQVLALGARVVGFELAKRLVSEWIGYCFDPASPSARKLARISQRECEPIGPSNVHGEVRGC